MRVVWIASRAHLGAVEHHTLEASRELARRGHEQCVLLPGAGALVELLERHASVHIIPHNPWVRRGIGTTARWTAYNVLVAMRQMMAFMRATKPDVVVTETIQLPTGALAARCLRIPHVWSVHGVPQTVHQFDPLLLGTSLSLRAVNHLSDRVLCVSKAVEAEMSAFVSAERIHVIAPTADVPPVSRTARPAGGDSHLIILGRKSPGKGQHEALNALKLLRARGMNVTLDIVGSEAPGYELVLRGLARELGLEHHVRFLPHREDGQALLASADVALVCSRRDAFPRVTIEAMKLGVPIVAARDYGVLEQVTDRRTGLLYEPGDIDELADCIAQLLRDTALASKIAETARSWASQTFNSRNHGDDLVAALTFAVRAP